ncbi:MAG: EutN/CcmL family microcompartment protein [Phycisphaerales bacterium]|jgi:microcompartment protein CcmK/EutM|nr:EutN/CcmL family microcompartment protein [Phycisphaerales bacterium]
MILGKIVGTVVCTQRADNVEGARFMLVEKCDQHGTTTGEFHVALDQVGAGPGEVIFMSNGSPNRQTERTFDKPIDASILGIVDMIDESGKVVYSKEQG